ncbi:IS630 family transposase [Lewinella sp. JB7]|uniref:IS630 family transposase n=1 Tax=Lewinella sp. JB7 TaxID=2962887 RepID=UPI0020C9ADC0|nr:IS630 family transposase [Lewinella sp. JB7]MCP9237978.1 IS630 family transposase [Lewinella sp. JB7]
MRPAACCVGTRSEPCSDGSSATSVRDWRDWLRARDGGASRLSPPAVAAAAKLRCEVEGCLAQQPPATAAGAAAAAATGEQRWKLRLMARHIPCFVGRPLSTIQRCLAGLGVSWQRGRQYVHSPDPDYAAKVHYLMTTIAGLDPGKAVVLFADQLTYYNHASVGYNWAGHQQQPRSHTAIGSTRSRRIAGLLDLAGGELTCIHRAKTTVVNLIQLYELAVARYPGKRLYIVVDNWPVHYHCDLLACLEPQQSPFPRRVPKSWIGRQPQAKYAKRPVKLPIQLLSLPTYASWLNPIEKVWRRLKDQVLHLHGQAQDFAGLQQTVVAKLEEWSAPNRQMLGYCGLLATQGLYSEARRAFLGTDP